MLYLGGWALYFHQIIDWGIFETSFKIKISNLFVFEEDGVICYMVQAFTDTGAKNSISVTCYSNFL